MSATTEEPSRGFLQATDEYWFGHGSPVTLGLYRILLGTLAFVNFVMIGAFWEDWFSERGYIPAALGQVYFYPWIETGIGGTSLPRINLLNGVTDPRITIPFYVISTLAALTTALGLWTRVSTIVLALGVVSIQHRNGAILHGGDTVLRVMVLYLALSPCGKACSLDRLIGIWKGRISPDPVTVSLWTQRLITFNVALVYFTTVWLKYFGGYWRTGIATYFPARLAEFFRFPVPKFVNDLPFVYITTYGTLFVEFAMATLVFFRPLRKYAIAGGIGMHLYIEYSMNIPLFSFLMISAYICFYEGDEFVGWAKRVGARLQRFATVARYPLGTQLRPTAAAFLNSVDPFGLVSYEHGTETKWTAERRKDGRGLAPVFGTWSRSVGSWAFAWIPVLWKRILESATEPAAAPAPTPVPTAPAPAPKAKKKAKGR